MLFPFAGILGRGSKGADDPQRYRDLISENLKFVEERCYRAYGIASARYGAQDVPLANRADALMVEVLDHLRADNYRVLREYKGRSSMKRYLEVVIANKVVDIYRRKEGRSRAADEARKMGDVGVRLYELVFETGLPVAEAHDLIAAETDYDGGVEALEEMAERIRAKRKRGHVEVPLGGYAHEGEEEGRAALRVVKDDSGSLTVPDDSMGPERAFMENRRESASAKAIAELARLLSPEEKLMVKMRYNGGMKVKDIAAALGLTEKGAYRAFDSLLARCRKALSDMGFGPEDLL